jgi:hypothetical protein
MSISIKIPLLGGAFRSPGGKFIQYDEFFECISDRIEQFLFVMNNSHSLETARPLQQVSLLARLEPRRVITSIRICRRFCNLCQLEGYKINAKRRI